MYFMAKTTWKFVEDNGIDLVTTYHLTLFCFWATHYSFNAS